MRRLHSCDDEAHKEMDTSLPGMSVPWTLGSSQSIFIVHTKSFFLSVRLKFLALALPEKPKENEAPCTKLGQVRESTTHLFVFCMQKKSILAGGMILKTRGRAGQTQTALR